jgi:hypothetical protein
MRSLADIRADIERLTERRTDIMQRLSHGHDAALVAEHNQLEDELAALWEEQRIVRAHVRFGDRNEIIRRARQEERLDRAA